MANSLEEAHYTWLKTQTTVTSLAPVYWIEAPKDAETPYIVFWLVDDTGVDSYIRYASQGVGRIQHDIYAMDRGVGVLVRSRLLTALRNMHVTVGGYDMYVESTTEQTLPKVDSVEPFHFVVDAVIVWRQ